MTTPWGRRRAVATTAAAMVALAATVSPRGGAATSATPAVPFIADGGAADWNWSPIACFTDEWAAAWDWGKWRKLSANGWLGRAPSVFKDTNVLVGWGYLMLLSTVDPHYNFPENPPGMPAEPRVYGNFTTSYVESQNRVRYGYFEVQARVGRSAISSAFWMSWNDGIDWTELDVYEIGGGAVGGPGPGFPYVMFTNTHVFTRNGTDIEAENVRSTPGNYVHSSPLADNFHVYALDWSSEKIFWMFDGRPVRMVSNVYHQQALSIKLDSETMPTWFHLPPDTFVFQIYFINYLRSWSRLPKDSTRDGREDPTMVKRAGKGALISPYALQRAPMPGSKEVAGLAPPVPRGGWGIFRRIRTSPRLVTYNGPVFVRV